MILSPAHVILRRVVVMKASIFFSFYYLTSVVSFYPNLINTSKDFFYDTAAQHFIARIKDNGLPRRN